MIENTHKDQFTHADTASSEWNNPPQSPKSSNATDSTTVSTAFSPIEGLEEQATRVQGLMERNALSLQQLQHNSQLTNYIEETQTEVDILRKKNAMQLGLVRSQFDQGISDLLKRVDWWKREQDRCKAEAEEEIKEGLQDIKTTKQLGEKVLSDELRQVLGECREATAGLGKEIKDWKRETQLGRDGLLRQLESISCGLDTAIDQERVRRGQYQSIVVGLLERTCEQGERLLRRIC